tara:strand:- start:418 stop:678 length:261 start_codon:yes stop_codon:yes gene_type:complete
MNINKLISTVKKKLESQIKLEKIIIEDKSFLHKDHPGNTHDRYHIKLTINSIELSKMNKIERTKKIYKILDVELKTIIHSLQILIK